MTPPDLYSGYNFNICIVLNINFIGYNFSFTQMDILDEILSVSPSTWRKVANSSYDDGYYCEQLSSDSVEYRLVSEAFRPHRTVKYIKRVQNPYQLALFKISREKAQAEGRYLHEVS